MSAGALYVARSSDYPGMVKVGFTTKGAATRVKRLSGAGSLARWELIASREVRDTRGAERLAHARLEQMNTRVAARREFFKVDVPVALRVLEEVARRFAPAVGQDTSGDKKYSVPAAWGDLLRVQCSYGGKIVSIEHLLVQHAAHDSRLAESRLNATGIVCVNRHQGTLTYVIDPQRASSLLEELVLSGRHAVADQVRTGARLTVSLHA